MVLANCRIGFIGAGNMATAIMGGLIQQGFPAHQLIASDPNPSHLENLQNKWGIQTSTHNHVPTQQADYLILAVKPQVMSQVCAGIQAAAVQKKPCIISIAAGISIANLSLALDPSLAIIRCMPNTPALIGEGAAVLCANSCVNDVQKQQAEHIFKAVGLVDWVEQEELFHAITALFGSGPAYYFWFMEILAELAKASGLPMSLAERFVKQTAVGSCKLALQSDASLAMLREQVTSKGGTTEAALKVLQAGEFKQLIAEAIQAACDRSRELG